MKVKVEVDIQKIAQDYINKTNNGVEYEIEYRVKNYITELALKEIKEKVKLNELITDAYGKIIVTDIAKSMIKDATKQEIEAYTSTYIKQNLEIIIRSIVGNYIETKIQPQIEKMIKSMLVINEQAIEDMQHEFSEQDN